MATPRHRNVPGPRYLCTPKGTLLGAKLHTFLCFPLASSSLFSTRVKTVFLKGAGVLKTAQTVNGNAYSPDQGSSDLNYLIVIVFEF